MSQAFDSFKSSVDTAIVVMKQASDVITGLVAKIPTDDKIVDPQALTDAATALSAASAALSAASSAASPPAPVETPPAV